MDPNKPWDLKEDLLVCPFESFKHGIYMYSGVELRITGDPRDVAQDRFKLEVADRKPSYHLLLTKPALPATHHEDRVAVCNDADTPECSKDGYKVAMQSYADADEKDKKKVFDVFFPPKMKLTDVPFVPTGEEVDDKEIASELTVVKYNAGFSDKDDKPIENVSTTVVWRLVDLSTKRKLEADSAVGPKGLDKIKKKLRGI